MSFRSSTDPELVMNKQIAAFVLIAVAAAPVWAAPQTVTLAVPGMTCAACPITVKQALSKVDGVTKTEVILEKREAIVTFDNAKTNVNALTEATKNAGYPSTPVKGASQ
jgi:periplasmic mercuric ion binding protein